jgi:hypothetical protein
MKWTHIGRMLSVCPSVHIIRLDDRWTASDEIWYGRNAIENYSKIILYSFL